MKRNGKTAKGTPRWRCKNPDCGASTTKSNTDAIHAARFRVFMDWIMGTRSLDQIARLTQAWPAYIDTMV